MSELVLAEVADGIATVTLNRPESRNALNSEMLASIPVVMGEMEDDDRVEVIVLTGVDPAFCSGLDLKELGSTGANLRSGFKGPGFWAPTTKPVIGAVNGPVVTGGLEMALQCDFLVASERARFGDTHARVGVIPGGGMSALLPQAVGVRKAIQMSLTGRFLEADEALRWGLVTHVVAHEDLLGFTRSLAADIAGNDPAAVRILLEEYRQGSLVTAGEAWRAETERFRAFHRSGFDPAKVASRRQAVVDRGRQQAAVQGPATPAAPAAKP
ncbi:MAG: enoyl-CoA hydratase [Acidimicrobiales bacterium]